MAAIKLSDYDTIKASAVYHFDGQHGTTLAFEYGRNKTINIVLPRTHNTADALMEALYHIQKRKRVSIAFLQRCLYIIEKLVCPALEKGPSDITLQDVRNVIIKSENVIRIERDGDRSTT